VGRLDGDCRTAGRIRASISRFCTGLADAERDAQPADRIRHADTRGRHSSTGDEALDARLPFDEPYDIPGTTAHAIERARLEGRRIVAVGTTVVRALEHAAGNDGRVLQGTGLANQRIGPSTPLRIVNAILSGVHEPGTSHYQLLRAFADDTTLGRMQREMVARDYRTHEFGDSVLIEAQSTVCRH
jgi:S-adenosylmethionine:tRNA ribosyltransferase-isomerase